MMTTSDDVSQIRLELSHIREAMESTPTLEHYNALRAQFDEFIAETDRAQSEPGNNPMPELAVPPSQPSSQAASASTPSNGQMNLRSTNRRHQLRTHNNNPQNAPKNPFGEAPFRRHKQPFNLNPEQTATRHYPKFQPFTRQENPTR